MTGVDERVGVCRIWRQRSKPSAPGSITSRRKREGISRKASETTEPPLAKLCTSKPAACRLCEINRAMSSSSSTTKTSERDTIAPAASRSGSYVSVGECIVIADLGAWMYVYRGFWIESYFENVAGVFPAC